MRNNLITSGAVIVLTIVAIGLTTIFSDRLSGNGQAAQLLGGVDVSTKNTAAKGAFGGLVIDADGNPRLYGWAYDPDDQAKSIDVHFYVDGPAGTGTYVGNMTANNPSPDLVKAKISGNHRFSFLVPEKYQGTSRKWYVHAIDLTTGAPLLTGSGVNLSIPKRASEDSFRYSEGFSNKQGGNGWSYQYLSKGEYKNMTFDTAKNVWIGNETYLQIGPKWFHPGSAGDAVLTWTAPKNGSVTISGRVQDANTTCGDGINASILHNGSSLWSGSIKNGDRVGIDHSILKDVKQGDTLRFATNRGGTNSCDSTAWSPDIIYKKGPAADQPTCKLTVAPPKISVGGSAKLSWTTKNATSITVDQGVGALSPVTGGSRTINPEKTTTYTATVKGNGGTNNCSVSVSVPGAGSITVGPETVVTPYHELPTAKPYGGRLIDSGFASIVKGGELYWFNVNSSYWSKYKGTVGKPFAEKKWQKPVHSVLGETEVYADPPNGKQWRKWLQSVYQDGSNILGFVHIEQSYMLNGAWKEGKARVGLVWSTDYGESFKYLGHIITPFNDPAQTNVGPITYVVKDGYFHVYYLDACGRASARASVSAVIKAAKKGTVSPWMKYSKGEWIGEGHGGRCNGLPGLVATMNEDAAYSTYTGKYYMLAHRNIENKSKVELYESSDAISWKLAKTIAEKPYNERDFYAYGSIINENGTDNAVVGKRFYVYMAKDAARGGPNGAIVRWLVDLDGEMAVAEPPQGRNLMGSVINAIRDWLGW